MTWEEKRQELVEQGYESEYRPYDHNAALVHPCEQDGGTMDYEGFYKGSSHRAFAICRICGKVVEF